MKGNQRGIKMICEMYNKMEDVGVYVMDGIHAKHTHQEVTLSELLLMVFLLFMILIFISWWVVPLRILFLPLNKIKFKCER